MLWDIPTSVENHFDQRVIIPSLHLAMISQSVKDCSDAGD